MSPSVTAFRCRFFLPNYGLGVIILAIDIAVKSRARAKPGDHYALRGVGDAFSPCGSLPSVWLIVGLSYPTPDAAWDSGWPGYGSA